MTKEQQGSYKALIAQKKAKLSKLKSDRSTWESHWQELVDFILPIRGRISGENTSGDKRNQDLLENTAMQSNELLAGALHGMLTNPFSMWFELFTGDDALDKNDNVRKWLQDTTRRLHTILNLSNFQTEVHEVYLDLGCIGTAPILMEEDDVSVIRFSAKNVKTVYIDENAKGVIDEVHRPFKWDAVKIIETFGIENASKKVVEAYEKRENTEFEIVHCVYPRGRYPGTDKYKFPFISFYYLLEEEHVLEEKGFYENIYAVPRWIKTSNEKYGRSPGMVALPEAKTVNKMTEVTIKAAQLQMAPPMQAPDDGMTLPIKLSPYAINFYRAGSSDRIESLFKHDFRVDFGYQAMEQHRDRIRKAFYVDQFQMAATGTPQTATEVNQRTEERLRLLGPMLGRQEPEFLQPVISRTYGIASRRGLLQPLPVELKNIKGLTVRYTSLIARAQRQSEGDTILRTFQAVAPMASFAPDVWDNFETDEGSREIARIYGFPATMLRDKNKRDDIRKAKAQANAQALENQQNMQQADIMNKTAPALTAIKS
jgi:hypothetical protein